jgi:hypothetical protein
MDVFSLGGAAFILESSKQTFIVSSTMELVLITLDKAGEEAKCLRLFLRGYAYVDRNCASYLYTL